MFDYSSSDFFRKEIAFRERASYNYIALDLQWDGRFIMTYDYLGLGGWKHDDLLGSYAFRVIHSRRGHFTENSFCWRVVRMAYLSQHDVKFNISRDFHTNGIGDS